MILGYVLHEHYEEINQDIDGQVIGYPAVMPGEQAPVDGRDQGCYEQDEVNKTSFEQKLQKSYFHAEAIVMIPGKILVGHFLPQEIGAEVGSQEPSPQQQFVRFKIGEYLLIQKR